MTNLRWRATKSKERGVVVYLHRPIIGAAMFTSKASSSATTRESGNEGRWMEAAGRAAFPSGSWRKWCGMPSARPLVTRSAP